MKRYPLLIALLSLFSMSCHLNAGHFYKNETIDPKIRSTINNLNEHALLYFQNNDYAGISAMFSDQLKAVQGDQIQKQFMPQIQTILKGKAFTVFDEFYVVSSGGKTSMTIPGGVGDDAYTFSIFSFTNNTYVSLLNIKYTDNLSGLLTIVYGKYGNKWKINVFQLSEYSIMGKMAPELYKDAVALMNKGDTLDAFNYISEAEVYSKPARTYFKFKNGNQIDALNAWLLQRMKIKYPLPFTIQDVNTKPQLFNICDQLTSEGLHPLVRYTTEIDLKDTIALKKENLDIQKHIGDLFNGIDKNNKYIIYGAYNYLPIQNSENRYYGFVQKCQ